MKRATQFVAFIAALTAFAGVSSGYYHYLYYTSRTSPYNPAAEKFDLNVLPNKTLPFFISQQASGVQYASGDSFSAVVGQIRAAAKVWNDVPTSDLRLAYGGLNSGEAGNGYPSIEVLLGDVPPGLVATTSLTLGGDYNGQFVPVSKAVIILRQDLREKPSYGDSFFTTVVHEFGHALGLQHTFTGSVMATLTRSTGRSKPLTADDVAGVSLLYPSATNNLLLKTGSITGRVVLGNQGVHMATVVALPVDGAALSTMTQPDGTYRIDGLPPRDYLVYVAPLPPAQQGLGETSPGNVTFPVDPNGNSIGPSGSFDTVFYPNTKNPQSASRITVTAGGVANGIDFSVRGRTAPAIYSVSTFSYPSGTFGVKPAYLNSKMQYPMIVADGAGLATPAGTVGGFSVSQVGGGTLSVRAYPGYSKWAIIDVDPSTLSGTPDGPRHLVFTSANDIYVLPAAYWQTQDAPPSLTSVTSVGDGVRTIAVTGANLNSDTRIQFDGVTAASKSLDDAGRLLVIAPQAPTGYRANVVAVNPDGQSSAFIHDPAPAFTFESDLGATATSATISPSSLSAGSVGKIDITATSSTFADGQVWIGFGTSDIVVQRIWVVDGNTVRANVSVLPGANLGLVQPTIVSGLQTLTAAPFEITGPNSRVISLSAPATNTATGTSYVYPGANVGILVANTSALLNALGSQSGPTLFIGDKQIPYVLNGRQILFQIPASQPVGLSQLRFDSPTDRGLPVMMQIDAAPPQITGVTTGNKEPVDENRPVHPGDTITLQVTGLGNPGATIGLSRVVVSLGITDVTPSDITASGSTFQVTITIPANFTPPTGPTRMTLSIDGHTSAPINLVILPVVNRFAV